MWFLKYHFSNYEKVLTQNKIKTRKSQYDIAWFSSKTMNSNLMLLVKNCEKAAIRIILFYDPPNMTYRQR
jgi:hypothetical protein